MGYKRNIGRSAWCAAILLGMAEPSAAAPREPLIVTPLGEPKLTLTKLHGADDRESALDDAIESVRRAIGQAAATDQEATQTKCRSTRPNPASAADRFAWAASCRYTRR